ncbi:Receptor like protein 22 [Sesamum angolense]|uniref:Receptor like protein 22 n=1 Tax=Sesamum angolense TaxID=2727404 RepID=A0AAE1WMD7_9LAMI|nr:Receptor like protein 22 [Sesamum angolense]
MFPSVLFILLFFSNSDLGVNLTFVSGQCLQGQKKLLLELRNNLTYDSSLSTKLVQWNESVADCCRWAGVKCDTRGRVSSLDLSGESISDGINNAGSSLFSLVFLENLSLAQNSFSSIDLPFGFGKLTELRYLNLSNSGFSGQIPLDFSNLTRLVVLDFTNTIYSSLKLENPNLERLIHNFTRLRELYLDGVNISAKGSEWCHAISSSLPNLGILSLSNAYLTGPIDSSLVKLRSLSVIRLDENTFSSPFPEFFADFPSLRVLTISSCNLSGVVPAKLFQVKSLETIDLSGNRDLEGSLPEFPLNGSLENLWLSYTKFSGNVSESIGSLRMLSNLDLRGRIPDSLWEGLEKLSFLDLSENSLLGELPASLFALPSINVLTLNNKQLLRCPIPRFLFELQNLSSLSLSANNFNGSVQLTDFQKLTNLVSLDLSYNHLSVHTINYMVKFLIGHGKLVMEFSASSIFLITNSVIFKNLMSFATIITSIYIPNKLGGEIPVPPRTAVFVDMSSNNFSSPLPANIGYSLTSAYFFSLANNKIVGTIPPSLCNATRLQILDLSNNRLHDRIPSCLFENTLGVLNLRRNNLSGDIPDTFPVGCGLATLDLSWSVLQGQVPNSLARCTEMEVLNLGNNDLNGNFPCWLKNLTRLRVLVLSNNKFHGNISCLGDGVTWPNLQIVDIASNEFNSVLPENLFQELKALTVAENGLDHLNFVFATAYHIYYQDSVTLMLKGQGELKSLYVLNFSHNALSGHIPGSIGNLEDLESLDLSFNNLGGEIPQQLASLTFLSFLNLSYNNLVGRIPQGSQMQTFPYSSFLGNEGLCGFPLNKTCTDHSGPALQQPASEEEDQKTIEHGIYVSAALGFVVGVGVIFGPLVLSKRWRRCYNKNVNKVVLLVLGRHGHQLENEDW